MSYNILKKNVKFSGPVSGTIEGMVDTSTDQTIGGHKTFGHTVTSSANVMLSGSGKVSASFYYGDGSNLSGLPSGVGGANTQVQFNDEGVFSGSSSFTFATGSSTLSVNTGSVEVLSASNYVSASTYYGDASNLINVTADSVLAQNIVGQLSASQISHSSGLTNSGGDLVVQRAANGGIGESSGLKLDISNLASQLTWPGDASTIAVNVGGVSKQMALSILESDLNINASNINNGTINNTYLPSTIDQSTISASTGISGAFFQGDGSGLTGVTGAPTPVGSNTEIQFNADGTLGSSAGLTFSTGSNRLSVTGEVSASSNGLFGGYVSASSYAIDGGTIIDANANINCGEITASAVISSSANISGAAFFGDGRTLSGVPMQASILNGILRVSNPTNQTITSDANFVYDGADVTLDAGDFILTNGNITASGHVSASTYYGDASNLTNIPAGSPTGSNTQIQFNADGAFGASSKFTFATSSATLEIAKSSATSNESRIWFHSGSNEFGAGSGSFIESDGDDHFVFDNNTTDAHFKFITRANGGDITEKITKLTIFGNVPAKGVALGNPTGIGGTDTVYVGNLTSSGDTTVRFRNVNSHNVSLIMTGSTFGTTLTSERLSGDFKIRHDGGNIIFSSSVGPYAEFDAASGYLFKATKLHYKEVACQLSSGLSKGTEVFLPFVGTTDSVTQNFTHKFVAPFDGQIVKIMVRCNGRVSVGSSTLRVLKASDGTEHPNTVMETETLALGTGAPYTINSTLTANFTSATFSKGDVLGVGFTPQGSSGTLGSSVDLNMTIVFAYDELS